MTKMTILHEIIIVALVMIVLKIFQAFFGFENTIFAIVAIFYLKTL